MARIRYTYQNFPNCPRATQYSKDRESATVFLGVLIGPLSIASIITFFIYTFQFFGKYDWLSFLAAVLFLCVMAMIDIAIYGCRPNKTRCELSIILMEAEYGDCVPSEIFKYGNMMREKNKKENRKLFLNALKWFGLGLGATIAVIAAIKGVYYLCHKQGGLFLLIGAIEAIIVLATLLYYFYIPHESIKDKCKKIREKVQTEKESTSYSSAMNDDIMYCRICGNKVLSDSKYCSKCGNQVR